MTDQENTTPSTKSPATTARNAWNTFKEGYARLNRRNRIALLAGIPLVLALILYAVTWGTETKYDVLFSNLSSRDGGSIITNLEQMQIPYEMGDNGTAILIPSEKVYETRLRLATLGLPQGGNVGFELLDNARLGRSQFEIETTYQRALEGELARTISALGNIEFARVHLAIPKPSLFLRERNRPTASVMIQMIAGRALERTQVDGIVHLVSSSVPELLPSAVSIVDQNGILLSTESSTANLDGEQLQVIQNIEQQYSQRIRSILIPLLGADNIKAQVTVDMDFSAQERTEKVFSPNTDPANASLRSRQLANSSEPAGPNAEGVPGTLTNQPPGGGVAPIVGNAATNPGTAGTTGTQPNELKLRTNNSSTENFEVNESVTYTNEPRGRLRRISAAVILNNRMVQANNGNMVSTPISNQELEQITALVRDAIGATDVRKDTVTVMNIAFDKTQTEPEAPAFWKEPGFAGQALKVGFAIVLLLVLLYLIFGVIRPAIRQLLSPPPLPNEEGATVAGVFEMDPEPDPLEMARSIARENPQVVALVIRQWMAGETATQLPGPNTGGNATV